MPSLFIKQLLLFINLLLVFPSISYSQDKQSAPWLFIYYMPYDNNLSHLGEKILDMIQKGINSKQVIAVVQADYSDMNGMVRYTITRDTITKIILPEERSSQTSSYEKYLAWVDAHFDFQKSAAILLDHGGKLDELCLDEQPEKSFLRVDSVKSALAKFNTSQKKTIDLLFLQVCTKSSIEPLYEFKDVAKYTLASQSLLGAPNYYYEELFDSLGKNPGLDGLDLARLIADFEASSMYEAYTCVDNSQWTAWKEKYETFFSILDQDSIKLIKAPLAQYYAKERYWDLVSFLGNLALPPGQASKQRDELCRFIKEELIVMHKINPKRPKMQPYSGLSILAFKAWPSSKKNEYKHLAFFSDIKLDKIEISLEYSFEDQR